MSEKNTGHIHRNYIILILSGVVIYMLTVNFGENEKTVELMNFGLAISSILLALIAIFHAVVSSDSHNRTLSKLDVSAGELNIISKLMKGLMFLRL